MLFQNTVITLLFLSLVALNGCSHKFHDYHSEQASLESHRKNSRGAGPSSDMPSEPGKCYAKCLMQDQYEEVAIGEYYIYTGDDYENENLNYIVNEQPASTRWEKRMADRNCLSTDPEDCMVWCLVEVPGIKEEYYEVLDTSIIKEFEIKKITNKKLVKAGGNTEWREVVCDSDLTRRLILNIQQTLIDNGYGLGPHGATGSVNDATKSALLKYQRDNALPVGQLDLETLEKLGVMY